MNLDTKYEDVKYLLDSQFSTKEKYVVLANYLFSLVKELSNNEEDEERLFKYDYNDLLDYTYVLEYVRYNSKEEVLLLAHSAHTILFLSNLEE